MDTLGRWMAHYIAELIQDAEKASPEEQPVKMKACCDAILNLWKHRHTLSNGTRPFEELEPLMRILESLNPEDDTPRYFRSVRDAVGKTEEKDEMESWLNLIDDLDYSAKILIRYCLTQAAQNAIDKSAEWVSLAEAAGADEGIEFPLIHMIWDEDSMSKESEPDAQEKKYLEERVKRLENFSKLALEVAADLRQKVSRINSAQLERI